MPADDGNQQLHERLQALLPSAHAESCQVVATFLDIRGFSSFQAKGESFDSALYLRSVYTAILTSYFPDADFFKPTGDGLLVVHELPPEAPKVPAVVSSVLARCVSLVDEFGQITAEDYMVNFAVPQQLGIGVARGSVTRLVSGTLVLDYTGRCLNLAARLMDKARPYGVVFADTHASQLMDYEVAAEFADDFVCIRGIAESDPISISVSDGVTITAADREPIGQSRHLWGEPEDLSVDAVRESTAHGFYLPRAPRSYEVASVQVRCPIFDKQGKRSDSVSRFVLHGRVEETSDGSIIYVPFKEVQAALKDVPATTTSKILGMTKTTFVTFTPFCAPKDE
jgi:class 3 adenylate cyclase